jgi:hypothetical protein
MRLRFHPPLWLLCIAGLLLLLTASVNGDQVDRPDDPNCNPDCPASFRGKPVVTKSLPGIPAVPTLVYNCAKMPAICNNVNKIYPRNPDGTLKDGPVRLHYDALGSAKDDRRKRACPKSGKDKEWYANHPCPEQDQPPVCPPTDSSMVRGSHKEMHSGERGWMIGVP